MATHPPSSRADTELLGMLERAFARHAGADKHIDPKELQDALGIRSEFVARQLFRCFDRDGNGAISREEFLATARTLILGSERDKLLFAFRLHDTNGDGFIDPLELSRMIWVSMAESAIRERPTHSIERLSQAVFAAADRNRDGRISFDEFEAVVRARPTLLWRMTRSEAIWIVPNEDLLAWLDARALRGVSRFSPRGERGYAPLALVLAWFAANATLIVIAFLMLGAGNAWMNAGRAIGVAIDLNGALILLPMMRGLLSRLRSSVLGRVIPFDDAVDFHRLVGHGLFALSVCHVTAFVVAFLVGHAGGPIATLLLSRTGLTGVVLLAVFALMWVCSLSFIRRTKHFELFYFTHLLYVAWFGLTIAHAPKFAFWAGVPLVGYLCEQLWRRLRRKRASAIVASQALRSGVTRLTVARPARFEFQAGNYAFVCIPAIARHEWHPFTISSAPERQELTFHVRALGNWTSALRTLVERTPDAQGLVAYVDGPYGTATEDVFASRFAVLIGAGIGVTPFASVLESMVLRTSAGAAAARRERPGARPPKLEKAYFFWLNRDQYSFEWFVALLYELEKLDRASLLEIHLCMTDGRAGASALGLELAREIMLAAGQGDIVTGLHTHTHLGPPDWETELRSIAARHAPHVVDVFFCGPPGLGARLRPLCRRLGMSFHEERF